MRSILGHRVINCPLCSDKFSANWIDTLEYHMNRWHHMDPGLAKAATAFAVGAEAIKNAPPPDVIYSSK